MKSSVKKHDCFLVLLICALLSSFCFIIHFVDGNNSSINIGYNGFINTSLYNLIDNDKISFSFNLHNELGAFRRRFFTNGLIRIIKTTFNLNTGQSFLICQFTLYVFNGLLIERIAKTYGLCWNSRLLSVVLFYFSFSVLFAFYRPIYTWDEPIQYFCFLLSIFFLAKNKLLLFSITLLAALMARETTLILIPAIFFIKTTSENYKSNMLYFITPIIFYFIFRTYVNTNIIAPTYNDGIIKRLDCLIFNFQDFRFVKESIFSLIISTILPTYLLCIKTKDKFAFSKEKKAFILTLIANAIIVYATAFARESRLFALPLLIILPFLGKIVGDEITYIKRNFTLKKPSKKTRNLFLTIVIVCVLLSNKIVYKASFGHPSHHFFNEYLFISLMIIAIHFSFYEFKKNRPAAY